MANLGFSSKLQIIIVPQGKTYDTSSFEASDWEGKIIFKEGSKTILVNGNEYGVDSTELGVIISALKNSGYLTEDPSTHVLSAQNPGSVSALLGLGTGTKIATASATGVNTVSGWISSITTDISNINTNITNLQTSISNAKTVIGATGSYITVTKATGTGSNPDSYTVSTNDTLDTVITTARNDAVSTAKTQLIGTGAIAPAGATGLPNGEVWMHNEEQTLSHLKELINNLGGKDLAEVQAAISAIKAELRDDDETGNLANTILDKLANFLNNKQSWTVNGATGVSNVEGIIAKLEEEIGNVASTAAAAHSTVGATGAYIEVSETSPTGTGGKHYTVSTPNLAAAISNAKTTVTGASGSYITVTKATGSGATPDSYQVSTTPALNTAISDAKTAAEATAKNYADSVISWTVIGATGAGQ